MFQIEMESTQAATSLHDNHNADRPLCPFLRRIELLVVGLEMLHSVQFTQTEKQDVAVDGYFDLKSLAVHLQKTPEQIRKLAERGDLPGQKIGGDWRFNRSEIFHWMEMHIGQADSIQLAKLEGLLQPGVDPNVPSVAGLLSPDLIFLGFPSRSRNSLITGICKRASETGCLWDPAAMTTAILVREEMHSTALENGVALLHPRRPQPNLFDESFIALAITPSGIPFGGPRGVLTDIFFLIASETETVHLRILARLSRLISMPELLNSLRSFETPAQVLKLLAEKETELDSGPNKT